MMARVAAVLAIAAAVAVALAIILALLPVDQKLAVSAWQDRAFPLMEDASDVTRLAKLVGSKQQGGWYAICHEKWEGQPELKTFQCGFLPDTLLGFDIRDARDYIAQTAIWLQWLPAFVDVALSRDSFASPERRTSWRIQTIIVLCLSILVIVPRGGVGPRALLVLSTFFALCLGLMIGAGLLIQHGLSWFGVPFAGILAFAFVYAIPLAAVLLKFVIPTRSAPA
jgi:hypothetical protein